MILQALFWIFESALLILYGRFLLRLLHPAAEIKSSFSLVFMAGLVAVTTLASFLSLFLRLSYEALLVITVGGLVLLAWDWRRIKPLALGWINHLKNTPRFWQLAGLVVIGLILDLSTRRAANPDTGIYHAQAIHWLELYPAIPGLGNLHTRFAFNSSWLVINAFFSFAFSGLQSFHALPGLLILVFSLDALNSVRNIREKNAHLSGWVRALMLPLAFYFIIKESSSPGTDFPAILLLWWILTEWMAEKEQSGQDIHRPLLIALLAVFAVTIKLSIAPIALFAGLVFVQFIHSKRYPESARLVLAVAFVLLPWFARNYVLSGYLVYPQTVINWFSPDWKIPISWASREQEIIRAWAILPREDTDVVLAMPLQQWIRAWYFNQRRLYQVMLWMPLLLPVSAILTTLVRGKLWSQTWSALQRYLPGYLVIYLGMAFWLLTAPDFRFGIGFIIAAIVLGAIPWVVLLQRFIQRHSKILALLLLGAVIVFWGFHYRTLGPRTILSRLLIPTPYTSMSTGPCELDGRTILCAEWYHECGYNAFPCVPSVNPDVELRGEDWQDGFRWVEH